MSVTLEPKYFWSFRDKKWQSFDHLNYRPIRNGSFWLSFSCLESAMAICLLNWKKVVQVSKLTLVYSSLYTWYLACTWPSLTQHWFPCFQRVVIDTLTKKIVIVIWEINILSTLCFMLAQGISITPHSPLWSWWVRGAQPKNTGNDLQKAAAQ